MIYLDYAANTPVDEQVLSAFSEAARQYPANPNSPHAPGLAAKERMEESTKRIAALLGVKESEVLYTSGASESNNLAIKGIAERNAKYGKHIITTPLEHSSVSGPLEYLRSKGYEVEYADLAEDGTVDMESLKSLLRPDTVLVSICSVDSELGIRQPVPEIAWLLSDRPHCYFHTDATQAVGKIPIRFDGADLVSFTPHKFYGLCGCGVLLVKEGVILEPQIHGGISTTPFRSGTPALALAVSAEKALSLAMEELEPRYKAVTALNLRLREALGCLPGVRINSTPRSIPHILNISVPGKRTEEIQKALAQHEIYVATKSACCAPNTLSRPVYALTGDKKAALSTLRISLSHLTSEEDAEEFLGRFRECL